MSIPTKTLANGVEIPAIGMGTWPIFGQALTDTVACAYDAGYRLFDTADNYYNEADLGNALQSLCKTRGAKREELFIVTKISDELYKPGTLGGGLQQRHIFLEKFSGDAKARFGETHCENESRKQPAATADRLS